MLAKIWENEVNRIDNVRLSIIEYFSSFVVYAKVPMRKIYGSDSVPEKVIKLLSITSGIYEVFLERSGGKIWVKPEPRAEPYIPCYLSRRPKGGERSVVRSEAEQVPKARVHQNNYLFLEIITLIGQFRQYIPCLFSIPRI